MTGSGLVLVLISDTHELHRELEIPSGDVLIHAGDFTLFGKSQRAIRDFNAWLGELPHRHKIVICGNHEYVFDDNPQYYRLLTNAVTLVNESVVIEGAKFWGSPFPMLGESGPARRREAERRPIYDSIPIDIHVSDRGSRLAWRRAENRHDLTPTTRDTEESLGTRRLF